MSASSYSFKPILLKPYMCSIEALTGGTSSPYIALGPNGWGPSSECRNYFQTSFLLFVGCGVC